MTHAGCLCTVFLWLGRRFCLVPLLSPQQPSYLLGKLQALARGGAPLHFVKPGSLSMHMHYLAFCIAGSSSLWLCLREEDICLAGRISPEGFCLQDGSAQRTFALDEVRKQATQVGADALAMPGRVERISATLNSLEAGDTKLRVRALEVERAAKRASVMQVGTSSLSILQACGRLSSVRIAFNGSEDTAGPHYAPCCWCAGPVQGTQAAV